MDQQNNPTSKRKQHRVDLYFPNLKNYLLQEVEIDASAGCSFISRAYLISKGWSGKLKSVEDGHVCEHQTAKRVVLRLGYDQSVSRGGTFDVTFCLLEKPEKLAVISANEQFWVTRPKKRPAVIAPIVLHRRTKGKCGSSDSTSLSGA
jgi:hypothetical protein